MTLITWHNDGPLFKDGQVASEQGCCCGGGDCQPHPGCCYEKVFSLLDDNGQPIWPDANGNPGPPPGWDYSFLTAEAFRFVCLQNCCDCTGTFPLDGGQYSRIQCLKCGEDHGFFAQQCLDGCCNPLP